MFENVAGRAQDLDVLGLIVAAVTVFVVAVKDTWFGFPSASLA
jgi:hypothetical protein